MNPKSPSSPFKATDFQTSTLSSVISSPTSPNLVQNLEIPDTPEEVWKLRAFCTTSRLSGKRRLRFEQDIVDPPVEEAEKRKVLAPDFDEEDALSSTVVFHPFFGWKDPVVLDIYRIKWPRYFEDHKSR